MTIQTELGAEKRGVDSVQRLVRPPHPWQKWDDRKAKLKAARKEAKRRYERGDLHKEWERTASRIKRGIDPNLPLMKPWDHAKGRVA